MNSLPQKYRKQMKSELIHLKKKRIFLINMNNTSFVIPLSINIWRRQSLRDEQLSFLTSWWWSGHNFKRSHSPSENVITEIVGPTFYTSIMTDVWRWNLVTYTNNLYKQNNNVAYCKSVIPIFVFILNMCFVKIHMGLYIFHTCILIDDLIRACVISGKAKFGSIHWTKYQTKYVY